MPKSIYIQDVNDKFKLLFKYHRSDPDSALKIMTVLRNGRKTPLKSIFQKDVAYALGLQESTVSELASQKAPRGYPHNEGVVLDVAAIFGVAPPEEVLVEVQRASASLRYPHGVYEMLDSWWSNDGSPARECWAALAGGPKLLAQYELTHSDGDAGGSFSEFEHALKRHAAKLAPELMLTVHSERPDLTQRLLRRIDFRQGAKEGREHYRTTEEVLEETRESASTPPPADKSGKIAENGIIRIGSELTHSTIMISLHGGQNALLPDWINPLSGDATLDCLLPMPGRSETAQRAKMALYGGTTVVHWRPRDFVAHGHSFSRDVVGRLFNTITTNTASYLGVTLKARSRGDGLSLALAQLERALSTHAKTIVCSLIGDLDRASLAYEALDMKKAGELAAWAASNGARLERVVLIVDDVSNSTSLGRTRLIAFCNQCRVIFPFVGGPQIVFVFGAHGDQVSLHEQDEEPFELKLDKHDREACFGAMALREPTIIAEYPGGLDQLMIDHPPARSLGDDAYDAQAFIDYLLQYGNPSRPVSESWSARTSDLNRSDATIVGITSVAELLGLPVPERIALAEFSRLLGTPTDAGTLADRIGPLTYNGTGEWPGLRLSSPRRAKSLLSRVGLYRFDFLLYAFDRLISSALQDFYSGGMPALPSLSYARHIFQRIGKREFYLLDDTDKKAIAACLVAKFADQLDSVFPTSPIFNEAQFAATAKWTGTLSDHLIKPGRRTENVRLSPSSDEGQPKLARLVTRLWHQCAQALERRPELLSPESAVSLMRAARLLIIRSSLDRFEKDKIAKCFEALFTTQAIEMLIIRQLRTHREDRSRRTSELLHVFCQASDPTKRKAPRDPEMNGDPAYCASMSDWVDKMLAIFVEHAATFDPGMWIERARLVRVPLGPATARAQAIEAWNDSLERAWNQIAFDPLKSATWRNRIEDAEDHGLNLRYTRQEGQSVDE